MHFETKLRVNKIHFMHKSVSILIIIRPNYFCIIVSAYRNYAKSFKRTALVPSSLDINFFASNLGLLEPAIESTFQITKKYNI